MIAAMLLLASAILVGGWFQTRASYRGRDLVHFGIALLSTVVPIVIFACYLRLRVVLRPLTWEDLDGVVFSGLVIFGTPASVLFALNQDGWEGRKSFERRWIVGSAWAAFVALLVSPLAMLWFLGPIIGMDGP